MVRFHDNSKPPNHFSRRQQGRLLMLVMSLGLVLILANEARKPATWEWFDLLSRSPEPSQARAPSRRAARPAEDPPGIFRVSGPETPERPAKDIVTEESGRYFPGVRPQWLASIQDNTVFRPQESEAWFGMLGILARTDPAALAKASIGRVTRLQLAEQSEAYRGDVVSLRGTIRRAVRHPAGTNDEGITGYYQTWLVPEDSPDWLVVVYCLELPDGFPVGETLSEPVDATGFYFKQWVYLSQRGSEVAPLVLARGLQWRRSLETAEASSGPPQLMIVVGASAALALAMVLYVCWRTSSRVPPRRPKPEVAAPEWPAEEAAVDKEPPLRDN